MYHEPLNSCLICALLIAIKLHLEKALEVSKLSLEKFSLADLVQIEIFYTYNLS